MGFHGIIWDFMASGGIPRFLAHDERCRAVPQPLQNPVDKSVI
jgi:hypothetical protein